MGCIYCELIKSEKTKKVYEDDNSLAFLPIKPAAPGHIILLPKKHYRIIEEVPENEIENLFIIANKISSALFEALEIQGTNIIIENGTAAGQVTPHFGISIIPRKEKDGLSYQWRTKQLTQEEMASVELSIKEALEEKETQKEVTNVPSVSVNQNIGKTGESSKESAPEQEEENYLLRHINRIP